MNLPADLARPECRRVNIGVGGVGLERVRQSLEVASLNVLPCDREDIGHREGAAHASAIQRASLGFGGTYRRGQIRAEEHHDAAGVAALTEMNMSLGHRARERWCVADIRI